MALLWRLVMTALAGWMLAGVTPTFAEKRVALVIGNGAYQVGPLDNPVRDAEAIARALEGLGFDVLRLRDATKARMETSLAEIGRIAVGADIAAVYYAGHGTERDGRNYLIPVDARLERATDLDLQAISLATVLDQLAGATKLRLVVLDACRNNIFPLAGARRATTRGLARVEPDENTLVAYAARDGTTADDGAGQANSPFTTAFLRHVATPGLEIRFLLGRVRDEVMAATQRQQQPHIYGTLGGEEIYLRPGPAGAASTTAAPAPPSQPSPARPALTPRTLFRDCPTCAEMVVVPAGTYIMGSPAEEPERQPYESTLRVTFRRPFAVGRTAVTRAQYAAFVTETKRSSTGCRTFEGEASQIRGDRSWRNPGYVQGDDHPAVCVSFDDAKGFAAWLSQKTGASYRLLSEAEFEYVARAGTTTPFWWGRTISTDRANYNGDAFNNANAYFGGPKGRSRGATVSVETFGANPWGLNIAQGNVGEWTEDCFEFSDNADNPADGSARRRGTCAWRVTRGGNWRSLPSAVRSAFRFGAEATAADWLIGFRVARDL